MLFKLVVFLGGNLWPSCNKPASLPQLPVVACMQMRTRQQFGSLELILIFTNAPKRTKHQAKSTVPKLGYSAALWWPLNESKLRLNYSRKQTSACKCVFWLANTKTKINKKWIQTHRYICGTYATPCLTRCYATTIIHFGSCRNAINRARKSFPALWLYFTCFDLSASRQSPASYAKFMHIFVANTLNGYKFSRALDSDNPCYAREMPGEL